MDLSSLGDTVTLGPKEAELRQKVSSFGVVWELAEKWVRKDPEWAEKGAWTDQ